MPSLTTFLSVALLASVVSAVGNTCKTGNVVHKPVIDGTPVYFPATWREDKAAPALAKDQSCSWMVTIPQGYYAKLTISGKMGDKHSYFQTVDCTGNVVQTKLETKHPYYFPSPKFTLVVSNEAAATFAFKIEWAPYTTQISYIAGIGMQPHVLNITQDLFAADFSSDKVALFVSPADPNDYYSLRSSLVFEGQDYNGNFVANLYTLYETHQQWVSKGSMVYIVNLEASNKTDILLVQDIQFANFVDYVELNCYGVSTCSASVDGGDGKSAVLSLYASRSNETLVDIKMDPSATMKVYYGSETAFAFDSTYNGSTINSQLPLTFYGEDVTQYVISNGKATLTFNIPQ